MRPLTIFTESFLEAVRHYAAVDKSLARRFIESVDKARDEIIRHPAIGRAAGKYRCLRVVDFPYNFCYAENLGGELVALVLYYHKQKEPRV